MRILLQRIASGLYYEDTGAWTPDSFGAMDFLSSTDALEFCAANKLTGVQIVLKFDEEKREIVLPILPLPPGQNQRPTASL